MLLYHALNICSESHAWNANYLNDHFQVHYSITEQVYNGEVQRLLASQSRGSPHKFNTWYRSIQCSLILYVHTLMIVTVSVLSPDKCWNGVELMTTSMASLDLIPRPLPAFQRSWEKWEGLVCDSTWPSQPQGQENFKQPLVAFWLVYWSYYIVESYLQRSKSTDMWRNHIRYEKQNSLSRTIKLIPGQFQVKRYSRAVAYQALPLFSWMSKSWEWPGDEASPWLFLHPLPTVIISDNGSYDAVQIWPDILRVPSSQWQLISNLDCITIQNHCH